MSATVEALVLVVFILATSIWIGGYVAIAVVARTSASSLQPGARVALFRSLGRAYLRVGLPALALAYITGLVLAWGEPRDPLLTGTVVVALLLVALLAAAVAQAKRMSALRRGLLTTPDDARLGDQVRTGARSAAALRGLLGLLTVALVVMGSFVAV